MWMWIFSVWGSITKDTLWRDTVYVRGDVVVEEGVTLTILKGTVILFEEKSEFDDSLGIDGKCDLIIKGTLIAEGKENDSIIFDVNSNEFVKEKWGFIHILDAENKTYSFWSVKNTSAGLWIDNGNNINIKGMVFDDIEGCVLNLQNGSYGLSDIEIKNAENIRYAGYEGDYPVMQCEKCDVGMENIYIHDVGQECYYRATGIYIDSCNIHMKNVEVREVKGGNGCSVAEDGHSAKGIFIKNSSGVLENCVVDGVYGGDGVIDYIWDTSGGDGIGILVENSDIVIKKSKISRCCGGAGYEAGNGEWNPSSSGEGINIVVNKPKSMVIGGSPKDACELVNIVAGGPVMARYNYWHTVDEDSILENCISDPFLVDYSPWVDETHTKIYHSKYLYIRDSVISKDEVLSGKVMVKKTKTLPGVKLKIERGSYLRIHESFDIYGPIECVGTGKDSVFIRGKMNIFSPDATFKYTVFDDGLYGENCDAEIYNSSFFSTASFKNSAVEFKNCDITSEKLGIRMEDGTLEIDGSLVHGIVGDEDACGINVINSTLIMKNSSINGVIGTSRTEVDPTHGGWTIIGSGRGICGEKAKIELSEVEIRYCRAGWPAEWAPNVSVGEGCGIVLIEGKILKIENSYIEGMGFDPAPAFGIKVSSGKCYIENSTIKAIGETNNKSASLALYGVPEGEIRNDSIIFELGGDLAYLVHCKNSSALFANNVFMFKIPYDWSFGDVFPFSIFMIEENSSPVIGGEEKYANYFKWTSAWLRVRNEDKKNNCFIICNLSPNDINARYNYWNTNSKDTIEMLIWDKNDPSPFPIGRVEYEPFLYTEEIPDTSSPKDTTVKDDTLTVILKTIFYPPHNVSINMRVPVDYEHMDVSVYDIEARRVTELYRGKAKRGNYSFCWDMKDLVGRKVPAGVYFISIRLNNRDKTEKRIKKIVILQHD